jgi:ABC-2 type transport system ATP-binding protein
MAAKYEPEPGHHASPVENCHPLHQNAGLPSPGGYQAGDGSLLHRSLPGANRVRATFAADRTGEGSGSNLSMAGSLFVSQIRSTGMKNQSNSSPPMIVAAGLSKFYGRFAAVEDVSFEVPARQVCAFLGPNGAGKSTTMKLLTGYLAPTRGKVAIAGHDMETDRLEGSGRIGYLPENGPLYTEMTPASALTFIAKASRRKDRLDWVADRCQLGEVWNKPIAKLSRGFRQRVGMAQALVHDPEVLILDEPTSGLDPNQLVGIRGLITELGRSRTVLLSTHILQEVEVLCERVLLIDRGQLVFDGPATGLGANREALERRFHELTGFSQRARSA